MNEVRARIRDVPDFPKKGVVFKDITPVLADPALFKRVIDALAERWRGQRITKVVGVESRGFVFAAPLAYALDAGLVIVRKPGKLPWQRVREVYALEYGEDALEMHVDAVGPGDRAVIVDDVLATGGTAAATIDLVRRCGAEVVGLSVLIELTFLPGRAALSAVGAPEPQVLLTY